MLNWDSVAYLNLVDENGNMTHGAAEGDFPIAFIISPGAELNQNRTLVASLPECRANYNIGAYLEGGPNIDYATDLPDTVDTLWEILTTSQAAQQGSENYNDQVIAIYRNEWWDRVQQVGDLSYDNAAAAPAVSRIEILTQSLAECIAVFGNDLANPDRWVPYPAPLDLDPADLDSDEYHDYTNYEDDNGILFGRFPQDISEGGVPGPVNNFVFDSGGLSYCENAAGVTAYDEEFWGNWKDHFFYVVSEDFESGSGVPIDATKCTVNGCIGITGKVEKVAAMVIFAGSAEPGVSRVWWWDGPTATATVDNKALVNNYLEGDNQTIYLGGNQTYDLATSPNDYSYCIRYNNATFVLEPVKCNDLL